MLIEWKNRYLTGFAEVDHEHRQLVDIINRLHDDATASAGADVEGFFGDLLAAISAHFALEERAMREAAYVGFKGHKDDHERLLDELRDIMDQASRAAYSDELAVALDVWFSRHFSTFDARLHDALGPH